MAKSKSGEFYTFDEVLRQLNIDENRLKRLVSEGEIRAFREGDQMKFKRNEIDNLAGKGGRSGTSDTSLTEISLEDDPAPRRGGETLVDDPLAEAEVTKKGGMRTAEISSQDTFIDKGGDVGMSTEPIDFTEDVTGDEPEQISSAASATRRGGGRAAPAPAGGGARRPAAPVEARTHPALVFALVVASLVSICTALVLVSISKQQMNDVSRKMVEMFYTPPTR